MYLMTEMEKTVVNHSRPDNKEYRGRNLIKYLFLPLSACLAVFLLIAFMLHLLGDDTRISSSEISQESNFSKSYEKEPLSSITEQTETDAVNITDQTETSATESTAADAENAVNDQQQAEPQTTDPSPSFKYEYLPQYDLEIYDGIVDPRTVETRDAVDPNSMHALVNKGFSLTDEFEPAELVPASGFEWFMLHPAAADAWTELREACLQETGIVLHMTSAYRSYDVQNMLFNSALQRKGIVNSVGYNSYQGRSEHQLGLAIDITDGSTNKNSLSFAQTETYSWMIDNAARFGYVLRYPAHKVHITDYCYEPWHFRYVGIELAHYLSDNDLTLEEYYGLGPLLDQQADPNS